VGHADLDNLFAVYGHAQRLAYANIREFFLGSVQLPVDFGASGREPEMTVLRILVHVGGLDIRHVGLRPVNIAGDGGEVGSVVAGESEHADAADILLLGLPIVWVLAQFEGLRLEIGYFGVWSGAYRF